MADLLLSVADVALAGLDLSPASLICQVDLTASWSLGLKLRTPGRRLCKVDCTGVSAVSGVTVVMALPFGHVDGEK